MAMKLSTTLGHIDNIPNSINASLVNDFYEYLKEIESNRTRLHGLSDSHRSLINLYMTQQDSAFKNIEDNPPFQFTIQYGRFSFLPDSSNYVVNSSIRMEF